VIEAIDRRGLLPRTEALRQCICAVGSDLMRIFIVQLSIAALVLLSFIAQHWLVLPLEDLLLPSDDLYFASFLFIPHGIKLVLAFVIGILALPGILIGQLLAGLLLGSPPDLAFITAAIGSFAVMLPVMLVRYMQSIPFTTSLAETTHAVSIAKAFFVVTVIASLLNSMFHGVLFHEEGSNILELRYLTGDILGAAFVLFALMGIRRVNKFYQQRGV
jgi:hypothetical protein